MGYYMAGDYYAGDYYAGDPGLFGFIGKGLKKIGGVAAGVGRLGFSMTPLGQAMQATGAMAPTSPAFIAAQSRGFGARPRGSHAVPFAPPPIMTGGRPLRPAPGLRAAVQRAVPGGATGMMYGRKRPSMNYTNPKALKRAMRRTDGFVKVAKRALKGSKYQIVTRGASRSKRRCR